MNNKLEQKILDLKKEYQQDKYHNSDKNIDDIDKNVIIDQANKVSNEVLNVFFKDEEPPLKIASLMKKLGFDLFKNIYSFTVFADISLPRCRQFFT